MTTPSDMVDADWKVFFKNKDRFVILRSSDRLFEQLNQTPDLQSDIICYILN